jgi:hypothetical protein
MGGSSCCKVCGASVGQAQWEAHLQASASQAEAAMLEREGDLGCQGSLRPCLLQDGECSIHRCALDQSFRMRYAACGMRMRAFCSVATEVFGYAAIWLFEPHNFRREYARILTHKIFKSAAYGNYALDALQCLAQALPLGGVPSWGRGRCATRH